MPTPTGSAWLEPVREPAGFWLEVALATEEESRAAAERVAPLVGALLDAERQRAFIAEELASRYEEIDLLYAISEILGQTVRLEEATQTIVREVSAVVGARRASIMVFDESSGALRTVAARGFGLEGLRTGCRGRCLLGRGTRVSRAAQVVHDPTDPDEVARAAAATAAGYRGQAFLSVPICYGGAGRSGPLRRRHQPHRPHRRRPLHPGRPEAGLGGRQPDRRRGRERPAGGAGAAAAALRHELELAHDLQLKLLPSPSVLQGDAEVAARCHPAESVGGDFYTFTRLGRGRVGVMVGDVASHGFSAALVMALVMSAAGIHAAASVTPDETLAALLDSLSTELTETEMYFSVFYGVLDPLTGRLAYANAGHPHAFRVPRFGEPERLEATAPPLGLATAGSIQRRQVPLERRPRPTVPLDRWPGGRAERIGRGVRRGAPAVRGLLQRGTSRSRGSSKAVLASRRCVRRDTGGRSHAADPEDLSVPRAKRRLGQHFLTDPRILGRIADALEAGPGDTVLEIGPGPGGLTAALAARAGRLVAIEKDADLVPALRERFPAADIVEGDALELDWQELAGPRRWSPATFPTTSPRLSSTRRSSRRGPHAIVFLVQKEVADRIAAPPGGSDYGALTVGVQRRSACGAALHGPGRRVPAAAQGRFGRAPADPARAAAGERRGSGGIPPAGRRIVRLPAKATAARSPRADRVGCGPGVERARDRPGSTRSLAPRRWLPASS